VVVAEGDVVLCRYTLLGQSGQVLCMPLPLINQVVLQWMPWFNACSFFIGCTE
jgi:hypothetical protein